MLFFGIVRLHYVNLLYTLHIFRVMNVKPEYYRIFLIHELEHHIYDCKSLFLFPFITVDFNFPFLTLHPMSNLWYGLLSLHFFNLKQSLIFFIQNIIWMQNPLWHIFFFLCHLLTEYAILGQLLFCNQCPFRYINQFKNIHTLCILLHKQKLLYIQVCRPH